MSEQPEKNTGAPNSDTDTEANDVNEPIDAKDAPPGGADAADPLAAARAEAAEMKDRLLRTLAELENYRRRAEKERQDTAKFAIAAFARDMLTVADNLRRGLETVSAEDRKANPAVETLAAGMELTERETLATLERHGIRKVDPLGEPFDHNLHQAMMEIEDASKPAGTVAQVMQAGYVLNDRLLRPAMVAVAKGGPAAAPAGDDERKTAPVHAPIANEDLANSGDAVAEPEEEEKAEEEKEKKDSRS